MSEPFKDFLISIGFAADDTSRRKAEAAQDAFEGRVTASDRRTTKARLREALIRGASDSDTFEKRVKHAERLEQIDAKFGGLMLRRTLRQAAAQAQTNEEKVKWLDRLQKAEADHYQRSISGLQRLAGFATTAAVAIQAATVALATYATHVAAKLEEMAYAADRTGSSVTSLKQFSMAVSQLGGTAGGALNDLEAFASRLRSNPQGYTAFLKSVGVEARDAQGNLRGAAELYKEFRKNVGERKPYEQQLLYAQEMGVSEQTWRATDPAKLAAEEAAQRAKYARMGYDPDKTAEDAKALQHALRDMFDSINIIGEKTAAKIFKDIGGNLKEFTTFIEQHGDQIAEILSKIAQVVLEVSKAILQLLTSPEVKQGFDWLLGMFGHVEEGTGKWIADTERIKLALEGLAVFVATIFVTKITGAFAAILKELGPLMVRLAPLLALMGLAGLANSNGVLAGPGDSRSVGEGALRTLDPGLADRVYGKTEGDQAADAKDGRTLWRRGVDAVKGAFGGGGAGASEGAAPPRGDGRGNPRAARTGEMMRYAMDQLRREGVPEESLKQAAAHLVGQATMESGLDPNKVHDNGTGYGIYGARDPGGRGKQRRTEMLKWLEANGYARNSAEGQMRYMAHEAMTDRSYTQTRRILMGQGTGDVGVDTRAITGNFEAPAVINDRSGAVRNALRVGPEAAPTATAPALPKMQEAARALSKKVDDGLARVDQEKVKAIGAATEGFDPSQYFKSAPPIGASTNNDNSVRHQSYNRGPSTTNIYTTADARETHELWKRHEDRQKADDLRHASNIFAA